MSLTSCGLTSGITAELGAGCTTIAPIYQGYVLNNSFDTFNFSGNDITDFLKRTHFYYLYTL